MSKFKKWIVILMIILISIIGCIGYLIYQNKGKLIHKIDEHGDDLVLVLDDTIQKVSIRNDYYTVQSCVNKFYIYYASMFSTSSEQQRALKAQEICNMLDTEYKKDKEITQDNIINKLTEMGSSKININKMYISEQTEQLSIYFVYGTLRNKKTDVLSDFSLIVKIDKDNRTFSIILQDYIKEKFSDIKIGDEIEFNYLDQIQPNNSNTYIFEAIYDETYITDIFASFRDNLIYNRKAAYESLDEEYRLKRFPTLEVFQNYVKNNMKKILAMQLSRYQKETYDDFTQYICVDDNENYYIVRETKTMDYGFILDTYTIDLPEFIEKYENSDDKNKVALNIEKLKEAINAKDYLYFYNKMDETFKKNNYSNYNYFENYLKTNLFEENNFEYKNIEKKSNVYVATVLAKNKKNIAETKEIEVIMKLTDTTDYYISFNLQK